MLSENLSSLDNRIIVARDIEATTYSVCVDERQYIDAVKRALRNVANNIENATQFLAITPDDQLLDGTIVERIRAQEKIRRDNFRHMLQEKTNVMDKNRDAYKSSMKCRRCGSDDISWELKQTKSADEATTAFCVCAVCQNRWTMY